MVTGKDRSEESGMASLQKREDILWAAGVIGLMGLALTFFVGPLLLPKGVGVGFTIVILSLVVGVALSLAIATVATRGKGGLAMLRVPTPREA